MHAYLHATSAVGVCCIAMFIDTKNPFSLSINRFRDQREIPCVTLKITGFSPAPVKLLCWSSDEDSCMLVSTYELSVLIASRARGGRWENL